MSKSDSYEVQNYKNKNLKHTSYLWEWILRCFWFFIILWNMAQNIYIYVDPWQSKNNLDWLSTKNYYNTFSGKVMLPLWLCSFLIILYHLQFQTIVCHATQLLFLKRMLKSINNNQITNNTIIWSLTSYRFNARKQGLCGSFKKRHKLDCVMKAEIWTGILIFLSFAA